MLTGAEGIISQEQRDFEQKFCFGIDVSDKDIVKKSDRVLIRDFDSPDQNGHYLLKVYPGRDLSRLFGKIIRIENIHPERACFLARVLRTDFQFGRTYVIEERLSGCTMDEAEFRNWRDGRRFTPAQVRSQMLDICRGLSLLHENGIIHQDIKPGNIFLCADGRTVLLDFDIARDRDLPLSSGDIRESRRYATRRYAAPELTSYTGQNTTPASDIYSIGLIMYELLFGEEAVNHYIVARESDQIFFPRKTELNPIIRRCLSVQKKRYPDSNALRRALCRAPYQNRIRLGTAAAAAVFSIGIFAAVYSVQQVFFNDPASRTAGLSAYEYPAEEASENDSYQNGTDEEDDTAAMWEYGKVFYLNHLNEFSGMIGPEADEMVNHLRYTLYDIDQDGIPELIYYTYSGSTWETAIWTVSDWQFVYLPPSGDVPPDGAVFFLPDDGGSGLYAVIPGTDADTVTKVVRNGNSLSCTNENGEHSVQNGRHFSTGRYLKMLPVTDTSLLNNPEDAIQKTTDDVFDLWQEWTGQADVSYGSSSIEFQ